MTALADREFEIDVEPRVVFGKDQLVRVRSFTPGAYALRTQTTTGPRGDFRMFGIDRKEPPTWAWSLWTDAYDEATALAVTESLAQVWDNDVRLSPESVVALRYRVGGRPTRRVYGRPRRFTPIYDRLHLGKVNFEIDFDLAEDVYYSDDESSLEVRMGTGYTAKSGIVLPQSLPWSFTATPSPISNTATIGGTARTWVTPTFYGPVTNPSVKIGNVTWGLTGSLPVGWTATISGLPWNMGVWRQDGLVSSLRLDPRSRLSALQMAPGNYTVTYTGTDNTASSKVIVRWRNATKTL